MNPHSPLGNKMIGIGLGEGRLITQSDRQQAAAAAAGDYHFINMRWWIILETHVELEIDGCLGNSPEERWIVYAVRERVRWGQRPPSGIVKHAFHRELLTRLEAAVSGGGIIQFNWAQRRSKSTTNQQSKCYGNWKLDQWSPFGSCSPAKEKLLHSSCCNTFPSTSLS